MRNSAEMQLDRDEPLILPEVGVCNICKCNWQELKQAGERTNAPAPSKETLGFPTRGPARLGPHIHITASEVLLNNRRAGLGQNPPGRTLLSAPPTLTPGWPKFQTSTNWDGAFDYLRPLFSPLLPLSFLPSPPLSGSPKALCFSKSLLLHCSISLQTFPNSHPVLKPSTSTSSSPSSVLSGRQPLSSRCRETS